MNGGVGPVYDRVPSRQLRELLAPRGFLAPLLEEQTVAGAGPEFHLTKSISAVG